jgi:hypothetical protein
VALKEFASHGKYKFMSDERDIRVAVWDRDAVWAWCEENGIGLEYQGTLAGTDVWRVRDERQRVLFLLKWS